MSTFKVEIVYDIQCTGGSKIGVAMSKQLHLKYIRFKLALL